MWKTFNRGRQERKGKEERSAVQPVSYVKGGGRLAADPQNNSRGSCRLLTLRLKWSTPGNREREERRRGRKAGERGKQGSKGSMGRPGKLSVASINCAARCCHRRCVAAATASLTADGAALRGNYNTRVCGACLDNWTTGWIANKIGNRNQKQKENQTKKPKAESRKTDTETQLGQSFWRPFLPSRVFLNCFNTRQCCGKPIRKAIRSLCESSVLYLDFISCYLKSLYICKLKFFELLNLKKLIWDLN